MRYRMVPEELVFWMGPIDGEVDTRYGVLCRRHADTLTVPRGWALDDSRDPTLRLFRPTAEAVRRPRRDSPLRDTPEPVGSVEQLVLDGTGELARPATDTSTGSSVIEGAPAPDVESDTGPDDIVRPPSSPLLARAFRGTPLER